MSKALNRNGAITLIAKTLARYPNNDQLIFELARHKFINARYKDAHEREVLLKEAAEGFEAVTKHTENDNRRAWAYHFLTVISLNRKEYDKAREYNHKLIGGKGLYPRVSRATIELEQHNTPESLQLAKETMYGSILEYSLMLPLLVDYHLKHSEFEETIRECDRAVCVLQEFNDHGLFFNELSCCCESAAFAFAQAGNYGACLDRLEKACEYAICYDRHKRELTYNVYSIMGEMTETEEILCSSKNMLQIITSPKRQVYDSIRENKRFQEVMRRLEMQLLVDNKA